jgi:hypothetical protein
MAATPQLHRSLKIKMIQRSDSTPPFRIGIPLAILCFLGFSITLPPLGLLLFLEFTGIVSKKSGRATAEWITPFQDVLMPAAIFGFALLSLFMVFTTKPVVFRTLSLLPIFLASTSIGGCLMGLSNLKNIGS